MSIFSSTMTVHYMMRGKDLGSFDAQGRRPAAAPPQKGDGLLSGAWPSRGGDASRSTDCRSSHISSVSARRYYHEKSISGRACRFSTFQEYTKCRMRKGNGKLYGHFADRLWVNQWQRNACCGAHVPTLLNYFPARDKGRAEQCLREFVAPAGGAVAKFNHKAGDVTVMKAGSKLSEEQIKNYVDGMKSNYLDSHNQPHYYFAAKGVIIEEMLPADNAGLLPMDYKFFVSDGQVLMVVVFTKRKFREAGGTLSLASGPISDSKQVFAFRPRLLTNASHVTRSQMLFSDGMPEHFKFEKPCGWDEMVRIAGCLSKGLPGSRIDLYLIKCKTYMSEVTMTTAGGRTGVVKGKDCEGDCARRLEKWLGSLISRDLPLEGTVRRHHLREECHPRTGGSRAGEREMRREEERDKEGERGENRGSVGWRVATGRL